MMSYTYISQKALLFFVVCLFIYLFIYLFNPFPSPSIGKWLPGPGPVLCIMLLICHCRLRQQNHQTSQNADSNFVLSPVLLEKDLSAENVNVKVTIRIEEHQQPVTFTCDVSSLVELIILQALCCTHDDLSALEIADYKLRVCGREEVLQNNKCLGSHEYIQLCRKFDLDIHLQLLHCSAIRSNLACTVRSFSTEQFKNVDHVIQATKSVCSSLASIETQTITDAVLGLKHAARPLSNTTPEVTHFLQFSLMLLCAFDSYEKYYITCSLTHGGSTLLLQPLQSKSGRIHKSFFHQIRWNDIFGVKISELPRETLLSITLYAVPQTISGPAQESGKPPEELGWVLPDTVNFLLSEDDKQLLWNSRFHLCAQPKALPLVLASAPCWNWAALPDIYALLSQWLPLGPVSALVLLHSKLLKDTLEDAQFGGRSSQILSALLCCCGQGLRSELNRQSRLVQGLAVVAEKVRQVGTSSRQVQTSGMAKVHLLCFPSGTICRLPISPSLSVRGINQKTCSYFSSNAVPLKIPFVNADPLGEEIQVMFKVGDDLRQDMLTLQMIKIMDKIWLQEGLDMRMVLFKCMATGKHRGMVELVPAAETLRKIQVEHGLTGSFKDKPLAEWLQKHNPTEQEYEKAVENFIYSCAGCCVATYVLGICDRHNDNIMMRTTGHMFHIDFGKFLGHAQMFGNIKRDRAPFVLTSDMAYVINGGDRPTCRFQHFVDLCSRAYNVIRKHTNLFLSLLGLMLSSGLPELADIQDLRYVWEALMPLATDAEATAQFTRLIESSLGSMATKVNFFIHNLAQQLFSGSVGASDEPLLSFFSKMHSIKTDGRIRDVSVFAYQKRYNPDKYYIYVLKVYRERQSQPVFILRTFSEFQELHNKLCSIFPSTLLPCFLNKLVLGRTHVEDVAARRKADLNTYLQELLRCTPEISECDLVYTFFHAILRDEKAKEGVTKLNGMQYGFWDLTVGGEVKLSISYRNSSLFVMVMHIKGLVVPDGTNPDPYVKTYLLPDPTRITKRKTKVSRKTLNPTYNEMLVYSNFSKESLKQRRFHLSVWNAEAFRENVFLGGMLLALKDVDLSQEITEWFPLVASLGE
uniref:Phosphatidylinositol-4-phosphate 3-kinase, catalytic subunit type 2 alpha n=1 Tax=Eptatretus burgeri TaxID=7764 RepID=A0A8C4Q4Q8_EPTBU